MFLDVRDLTITLKTGEEIAKDISFSIDGGDILFSAGSDWLSSWIYDPDTQRFYSKFSVLRDFLSGMRSDA